ncbi:MAG: hypothetical protein JST85_19180 [Acidobacteria bacterium]|nr:hypothetical protein [Acidobacteriota bacterium]
MNCQDFEIIILGMARAQLLDASARRQTIAHLAQCPSCADRLAEQQAITVAIGATAKSLRYEEAPAHVEQSLRAAFRKRMNAKPVHNVVPIRSRFRAKRMLAVAAAVFLLLVLAGLIRQWRFGEQTQKTAEVKPSPTAPQKSEPEPIALPMAPERKVVFEAASQRHTTRKPVRQTASHSKEITTAFIALADENQLVPLESGQVLRVKLLASTLISMGLPITADDVTKSVLADLVVGQDGMARAIRFVRPDELTDAGSSQPNNR